ncbi:MAG: Peptidase S16 with C-terminal Lon domain [Clostridiales bacterium 38_11]|nr:MAG: Peptidase S16 with C-terminal Lon domain [Clostridiales bacterium 38_11]HBH13701.1 ATP-dependent protease [Clostridiales bacterium]
MDAIKLTFEQLRNECCDECTDFSTTAELGSLEGIIGQDRAVEAIDFGLNIRKKGYNIFASGISGTGRNSYITLIVNRKAKTEKPADDWVYVFNFEKPEHPLALNLRNGQGKVFQKAIEDSIVLIKKEIENIFMSREYERAKNMLYKQLNDISEELLEDLNELAKKYGFIYTNTDRGLVSIPLKSDGNPMTEEDFKTITKENYAEIQQKSSDLNIASLDIFKKIRDTEENYREKLKKVDSEYASKVVTIHIDKIKKKFALNKKIEEYLVTLKQDIIDKVDLFKNDEPKKQANPFFALQGRNNEAFFERYRVNLFVDNSGKSYAPVVFETNPTYTNLLGNIEFENEMGFLKTSFDKISAGSLHAANGGYLVLQVKDLMENYYAYKGMMRALMNEEIKVETIQATMGYPMTTGMKPEPIPLKVKVIIVGDPYTYSMLYAYDEQFTKLFKLRADFDVEMQRTPDNVEKMAKFIAAHANNMGLRHFDKEAVCRVVEYSSRIAENKDKLTSQFNRLVDVLYEADSWATSSGSNLVRKEHVSKAIEQKTNRNNMYEEKILELFKEGTYLLDVEGEKVGEINGLAVVSTGEYSFGKPSKITVSTYSGRSGLINIEREARTSGKIHDKGVMIIHGYMGYKYAQDKPLALSASIVFEQLYSGIDGDSASSTELYAILSSLSEVPIKQGIAVTGSVNQRGLIQPIGGVNEKIEGYFKVCQIKGLTGEQGVIIPHQNVNNLMLSDEVIEAVKKDVFHVYAVKTVDEGIEILTGRPAGSKDDKGCYKKDTIHYLVDQKLTVYLEQPEKDKNEKKNKSKAHDKEDDVTDHDVREDETIQV